MHKRVYTAALPPSQTKVAAAFSLETLSEDMFAYVQMWELAPFVDDQLVARLVALKAAADRCKAVPHLP